MKSLEKDIAVVEDKTTENVLSEKQNKKIKNNELGKKVFNFGKFYIVLAILAFIRALFTYVFIIPNSFAPGGLSGLSSIIYNAVLPFNSHLADTVFNPGVTAMVMNIPLLIAGLFLLNKKFALNTFLCVAIYSGFMGLFSAVDFPQYVGSNSESGYMLLASLAGGAGCGISLGFMLRMNMSMGGTDVIGKIIYKYNPATDVQWWIFACDCVIVLASGGLGFIGLDMSQGTTAIVTAIMSPVLYSFISLVTTSEVADVLQSGMQSNRVFTIISAKHDEIAEEIVHTLHRGVTVTDSIGYYTGNPQVVLSCVVSKKQVNTVKDIIAKLDTNAFIYITKAKEVNGNGFHLPTYE